jgi:hypothetical protein
MRAFHGARLLILLLAALLALLHQVSCANPGAREAEPTLLDNDTSQSVFVSRVVRLEVGERETYLAHLREYHTPIWQSLHEDGVLAETRVFELTRKESSSPEIPPWHYLILNQLARGADARQFLAAEETVRSRASPESPCLAPLRTEILHSTPGSFYPEPAQQHRGRAADVVFHIEFIGVDEKTASLERYRDLMHRYFGPANGQLVREGLLFDFVALETVELIGSSDTLHPWNQLHVSGDLPEYDDLDWDAVYEDLFRRLFKRELDSVYSELPEIPSFSDYSGRLDIVRLEGKPTPPETSTSCERIAIAVKDCGMDPEVTENSAGCRVHASAATSTVAERVDPSTVIRNQLSENGWTEDLQYAADGPGTSAFAFRKDGISCFFNLGAPSHIEDGEIISAERYEFEAECFPE